jgi:hypothetical protein
MPKHFMRIQKGGRGAGLGRSDGQNGWAAIVDNYLLATRKAYSAAVSGAPIAGSPCKVKM